MNKVLVSLSLCVLLALSGLLVDGKRSGSRKQPNSGSRRQDNRPKDNSGNHGGSNQPFLDSERHDANRGHIGFEKYNPPQSSNPVGFGQGNYKPSAPVNPNPGIGSAFGGAGYPPKTQNTHVQSAPYPTHNNPGGNPTGGFGSNPGGQSGGFGQPGGFGNNPPGGHYIPSGGLGNNPGAGGYHPSGGIGQPGFGGNTHGSQYPPPGNAFGGGQPHGSQYPVGNAFGGGQPSYGGGYQGGHNNYGGHGYQQAGSYGGNPGGFGGHNPGGFGGGYNQGGYGGHPGSFGGGGYNQGGFGGGYGQGGMYSGGGYKTNSGPGFGTGLLGGAAGALPLGLLLGYGLGSMTSHSSPSQSVTSPQSPAAAPGNNEAYNTWLQQRTEEKKQEIVASTGDAKSVNQTAIINQILSETQMCPGGAGVLDASILNTMVPCNVTKVDFNVVNVTEPLHDDCKSLSLSIVQVNTATNENKTITVEIKQNNVTGSKEFVVLSYDVEMVACTTPINNPGGRLCATRAFTADPYHALNETMSYLHTVNISITQFNTTLNDNCTASGACGPDSKPARNLTSSFINLSILPEYPLNIMLHQCMIFKTSQCDPASTAPCDAPPVTSMQTINTNTTLTKADFAYINFVLHESSDVFRAYTPPPPENTGSSSSLAANSGTGTTGSSATSI